jgi:N-acetylated-alpha-linked acidic dipeptidase
VRGSDSPDDLVILGNHRDAWIFGGVDPSSGSASLMEVARGLGALAAGGTRPKRTILLASWDAEEFTLTSSTEWGEQHEAMLRERAIAYLNVDSSASGPSFSAAAVPSLNGFIGAAAESIADPQSGASIAAVTRNRVASERGALPTGGGGELVNNRLGSGSDYTVFLNFLGVPIADMTFDGPYGVYHSMYDNHEWVARFGDPGFRYHAAMARLWGVMALRLANADLLPLDYRPYASAIREYSGELKKRWGDLGTPRSAGEAFAPLDAATERLARAADAIARRASAALAAGDRAGLERINRALIRAERAFLDPDGIPGRPWYRHQVYAPRFTYAPEVLPAIAEALDARDAARATAQMARVAAAIDRAASTLR